MTFYRRVDIIDPLTPIFRLKLFNGLVLDIWIKVSFKSGGIIKIISIAADFNIGIPVRKIT